MGLQLVGAVIVSVGVGLVDWPAGVITAGALCIGVGALAEVTEREGA